MGSDDADRTLDVREIDGEPFDDIVAELDALDADETFLLINSFEPKPLYSVLDERGFVYETARADSGEWRIRVEHA